MIFKPKIPKVLQSVLITLVALICTLSLNTLQTHASGLSSSAQSEITSYASALVDSIGTGNQGGTDFILYGVDKAQTGYLCYMLTKDGAPVPGTTAVALSSPGYAEYPGSTWIVNSRKGNYSANRFVKTAPWNCTPWTDNGLSTNEPEIRAYFESMNGNVQNAAAFVADNWGNDIALRFGDDELILVIETLMNFQFSYADGTGSSNNGYDLELAQLLTPISSATMYEMKLLALRNGMTELYKEWPDPEKDSDGAYNYYITVRDTLTAEITAAYKAKYPNGREAGGRQMIGTPFVGTVPNLVAVKSGYNPVPHVFDSYINKTACFAERIQPGQAGVRAGFLAWTGDTSSQISDDQVQTFGLAMMVISARPQGQTTADESKIPTPHAPAKESEGNYSIVKSYRTKQGTTQYIDNGTFSINNISNLITIENEKHYQVVGWKITNQTSPSVSSINWNPPGSTQAEGTTPTSVKIADPNRCLYVLLEKLEEPPTVLEPYNYILSQSSITRRVHFSTPDNPLNNMNNPYIHDHLFTWIGVHHQITCSGHTFTDECKGHPHESDCPKACPDTCTKAHTHVAESCTDEHFCGKRCTTQTAYCSDWKWVDTHLRLSINNAQQSDYPDILATKPGWNEETSRGGLSKKYNPTSLIT